MRGPQLSQMTTRSVSSALDCYRGRSKDIGMAEGLVPCRVRMATDCLAEGREVVITNSVGPLRLVITTGEH